LRGDEMKCLYNDTLIVSNFSDDSISVIDLVGGSEIQKIKLCYSAQSSLSSQFGPHHIAFDEMRKHLYVPNSWHNSVSVLDLINEKIIDTIFVGSCPSQVVLCHKYNHIYVANTDSNSVSILNIDNFKLIVQVPTGEMPHGMAMTKDQERVFIGNYGSREITEISTKTNEKVKNHKVNCNPWHLRIDDSGELLFAVNYSDQFNGKGKVVIYETKTLKEIKKISIGKMPVEAISDKTNEYLYVTDSDMNCVHIYDLKNSRYSGMIKVNSMPHGIELDNEKRRLFVTSIHKNVVDVINVDTREVVQSILVGKEPTSIIKAYST